MASLNADSAKKETNTKSDDLAVGLQDKRAYTELEIDLGGLRGDISYAMRQKHYTETVRALAVALDNATEELEQLDGKRIAQESGFGAFSE